VLVLLLLLLLVEVHQAEVRRQMTRHQSRNQRTPDQSHCPLCLVYAVAIHVVVVAAAAVAAADCASVAAAD
jgi:hypothetical protein